MRTVYLTTSPLNATKWVYITPINFYADEVVKSTDNPTLSNDWWYITDDVRKADLKVRYFPS